MNSATNRKREYLTKKVTAVAHANIALIKYWGKRSRPENLPAVGSISLALEALKTETTFQFVPGLEDDRCILDGKEMNDQQKGKVSDFLDILAGTSGRMKARVVSRNNFPTAAGLASSSSGFAALTKAAAYALQIEDNPVLLSKFARRGSGSAARSIPGGFSEMKIGSDMSGKKDFAVQLYDENYWDIRVLIALVSTDPKETGSTEGMIRTARTSPYFDSWVRASNNDLAEMREALKTKNFSRMGELAEYSCMKMHGLMMSSRPPLLYWNPVTLEMIQLIWSLRRQGLPIYFTIDAGPQVKVLCRPDHIQEVRKNLQSINGISTIIESKPGPDAYIKDVTNS